MHDIDISNAVVLYNLNLDVDAVIFMNNMNVLLIMTS